MPPFPPVVDQLAVIRRGVEKIVPESELVQRLEQSRKTGTPLRVKYGIDPTGIDVHLGHSVPLRKIRQFQELGHQAVIIIGNYTALVGDPSGRDQTRARLTQAQVEENAKDYLTQVGKVVDLSKAEVVRNGDWFSAMSFLDILELCSKVTVAQLLTREDFAKRQAAEQAIFLHECLYPIMQAWDSVKVKADVELGGTEQLYSFMLARDLQRDQNLPQQIGIMTPILVGLDGVRRMGKSLGNYIGISEPSYEMMKKFMQLPDAVMRMYFELLTDVPLEQVNDLLAGHPKEAKIALAKAVIGEYHGEDAAAHAILRWQREVADKEKPSDIQKVRIPGSEVVGGTIPAAKLLVLAGLCTTSSDARRAIAQGGAYIGEEKSRIDQHDSSIAIARETLLWVGKKRVVNVVVDMAKKPPLWSVAERAYSRLRSMKPAPGHTKAEILGNWLRALMKPAIPERHRNLEIEIPDRPPDNSPLGEVREAAEDLQAIYDALMKAGDFDQAQLYAKDANEVLAHLTTAEG